MKKIAPLAIAALTLSLFVNVGVAQAYSNLNSSSVITANDDYGSDDDEGCEGSDIDPGDNNGDKQDNKGNGIGWGPGGNPYEDSGSCGGGASPNSGTVTYIQVICDAVTNGGVDVDPKFLSYQEGSNDGVSCKTPNERIGYTFVGWFTAPSGGGAVSFPFIPTGPTTLYAQWTTNPYTVTCDATTNGGTALNPASFIYTVGGTGITCPSAPARNGYTQTGWYTTAGGSTKASFPATPTSNVTYYAQWTPNVYVLTCDATTNGGAAVSPLTVNYTFGQAGVSCTTPAARNGYTLKGWYSSATGGNLVSFPYTPNTSTTVYAQWSENPPAPLPVAKTPKKITTDTAVVYFPWDSSKLDNADKQIIQDFISNLPSGATGLKIYITGYAQVARSASYDLKLSKSRAASIKAYVESLGVSAEILIKGKGWDDATAQARRGELYGVYTINQ